MRNTVIMIKYMNIIMIIGITQHPRIINKATVFSFQNLLHSIFRFIIKIYITNNATIPSSINDWASSILLEIQSFLSILNFQNFRNALELNKIVAGMKLNEQESFISSKLNPQIINAIMSSIMKQVVETLSVQD